MLTNVEENSSGWLQHVELETRVRILIYARIFSLYISIYELQTTSLKTKFLLTSSMAYETWRFNAEFTKSLQ